MQIPPTVYVINHHSDPPSRPAGISYPRPSGSLLVLLEDCGRPGDHAVSLLADLDERRSHNDFVGLPVSLKARMLQVVSTVLHTSRSQLVLSKGVLKP